MEELLAFLKKNPVFYLATDDDGQPRVRPFGFHMIFDGKFYMVSGVPKKVNKQMEKNPKIEFCSMAPDMHFVRVNGEAVFDNDNIEAKKQVFEIMPDLLKLYGSAENPVMSIFYLNNMHATIASLTEKERVLF
ncbi:MAG: pyridoxamine 5'-phosphate oxidase family protein [Candidatus Metalachnospira sp.]|nr:pyridoxamine 5'-phosphate oxidase family protein [Candidatus Metalachnospira sp.]